MPQSDDILSDRERRFVEEYLVDLCKSRAAVRAGYSAKSSYRLGLRLLKRPRVRAAVERAMARRSLRTEVDQDLVVQALAAVAFGDPRTLFDDTGAPLPMHRLSGEAAALIASLEIVTPVRDGRARPSDGSDGAATMVRIRIGDRLKALELLGKHLGLFGGMHDVRPAPADGDGRLPAFTVRFVGSDGSLSEMPPTLPS